METIILLGIGVLAMGLLVRQLARNTRDAGCSCCGCRQECGSHCQKINDKR